MWVSWVGGGLNLKFKFKGLRSALLSWTNLPAAIALVVVAIFGLYADHQNRVLSEQSLRAEVSAQASLLRAKLEGNINGNIQLVRGLVATVTTEPNMNQARFSELGANIFREDSQLRNIAVAPDLIVSLVYPLEGNERAIGLNYRNNEAQREAASRASMTGQMVLAGPVDLVQGGRAFIARFPVFLTDQRGKQRFWGMVSAVVDADRLYRDSGLFDPDLRIDVTLVGKDARGGDGTVFFGSERLLEESPVTAEVMLPSGSWQIAAVPKSGWERTPRDAWLLRGLVAIAGALVVIPILIGGRLVHERHAHFRELKRREGQLQRLSRRLEMALDASQIGVWELELKTNKVSWDDRIHELFGLENDGTPRGFEDWYGAVHPDDQAQAEYDYARALATGERYVSQYRVVLPSGEIRHIRGRAAIFDRDGASPKMVGAEWDVTFDVALNTDLERAKNLAETRYAQLETAKARIEHIALHDPLTGLPNRRYLDETLDGIAAFGRDWGEIALLHVDLDRFKQINDTLGHAAGDAILIHAAQVLTSNVRSGDFVARFGGDEFVVVCHAGCKDGQLAALADRIITQMRQPVSYQGHECRFGVSVGIAVDAGMDFDPRQLLVNADIALYRAKSRGRNRFEFFTEDLQAEIVSTKRTADEILNGLERNEFLAYYQPQFDARTLEIVGVEALARWDHPTEGILPPDVFLKIAEELNVVATIDQMILAEALIHLEQWRVMELGVPRISVNVSARRLQDEELMSSLGELNIRPGTVSFELVESIFLDEHDENVVTNAARIKELGIDIEIDDFGTGYASIVSLLKLKPRRLKIDRQLVMPIVSSPAQRSLVQSIIEIGKSLDIEVVAEGVETMEHARILRDLGCDMLQGYAFARPMSANDFKDFVRGRRWRAAS